MFKIFNYNKFGGVIGAFNVQYDAENPKDITDSVKPSDVVEFDQGEYAVYSHFEKKLYKLLPNEKIRLSLPQIKSEIYSVMKIENGFAPIGLADKYNSGGAILDISFERDNEVSVTLKDGGEFTAYCTKKPAEIEINGILANYTYTDGLLVVQTETKGETNIKVVY